MEIFGIVIADDVTNYLKILTMSVVALIAMGRTVLYLVEQYRAGNPDTIGIINTATATLINPIEDSNLDEWLEGKYVALDNNEFKKAIRVILDVTDPEKVTDATDARRMLHKFLSDTTDGDLTT